MEEIRPSSLELAKALEDFLFHELDVITESEWFAEKVEIKVKEILKERKDNG